MVEETLDQISAAAVITNRLENHCVGRIGVANTKSALQRQFAVIVFVVDI